VQAVLNVALPVFGIILCGYLAGRVKLLGAASSQALNAFVYWFALPTGALVFVTAQQNGVYVQRASAGIVLSTVFSVVTLTAILAWFGKV
jgi:predicted permease